MTGAIMERDHTHEQEESVDVTVDLEALVREALADTREVGTFTPDVSDDELDAITRMQFVREKRAG